MQNCKPGFVCNKQLKGHPCVPEKSKNFLSHQSSLCLSHVYALSVYVITFNVQSLVLYYKMTYDFLILNLLRIFCVCVLPVYLLQRWNRWKHCVHHVWGFPWKLFTEEGKCPAIKNSEKNTKCQSSCQTDGECSGHLKCCSANKFCKRCEEPEPSYTCENKVGDLKMLCWYC